MKTVAAVVLCLSISSFGLDQSDLHLETGIRGGIPHGIGLSSRITAYLVNIEVGVNYGYYINTVQMGLGFRLPIGEKNEIFLNFGGDRIFSKTVNLNLSKGAWLEIQHERSFGRKNYSTFAAMGLALYPESNEKNILYGLPVLKIGIQKKIFKFL